MHCFLWAYLLEYVMNSVSLLTFESINALLRSLGRGIGDCFLLDNFWACLRQKRLQPTWENMELQQGAETLQLQQTVSDLNEEQKQDNQA